MGTNEERTDSNIQKILNSMGGGQAWSNITVKGTKRLKAWCIAGVTWMLAALRLITGLSAGVLFAALQAWGRFSWKLDVALRR